MFANLTHILSISNEQSFQTKFSKKVNVLQTNQINYKFTLYFTYIRSN